MLMVELVGIAPTSEGLSNQFSTSVDYLKFSIPRKQIIKTLGILVLKS